MHWANASPNWFDATGETASIKSARLILSCARAASDHAAAAPPSSVMNVRRRTSRTGLRPPLWARGASNEHPPAHAVGLLHPQSTTEVGRNPWERPESFWSRQFVRLQRLRLSHRH